MHEVQDTRQRLLDAAEQHFAAKGFEGASLREITTEADANLAAANYHFGSKEDLFVAVLARRMEPVNRERLRLLDLAEAHGRGESASIEELLEAMLGPMLRVARDSGGNRACTLRLIGRVHAESDAIWKRIFDGPLREVRERFFAALHRALPELDETELAWRVHFVFATTTNVMADHQRLDRLSNGRCNSRDVEETLRRLIAFVAAGLRQPAAQRAAGANTERRTP